tara:strand:- start:457 stop:1125 length:669 start_codon:yes stop_codon:yes gene_type:complete
VKSVIVPTIYDLSRKFNKSKYKSPYESEILTPEGLQDSKGHMCGKTYELAKPYIKQFHIGIDVGSRMGEFSFYAQFDFEHLYCFDPNFNAKFPLNVDTSIATTYNCALGDTYETITMYGGMHTFRESIKPQESISIPLDRFKIINKVGLLKIDVEGFEKKVLLGAKGLIERNNPVIIIEQNHIKLEEEKAFSAKGYLESIGYEVKAICPRGWDHIMVRGKKS